MKIYAELKPVKLLQAEYTADGSMLLLLSPSRGLIALRHPDMEEIARLRPDPRIDDRGVPRRFAAFVAAPGVLLASTASPSASRHGAVVGEAQLAAWALPSLDPIGNVTLPFAPAGFRSLHLCPAATAAAAAAAGQAAVVAVASCDGAVRAVTVPRGIVVAQFSAVPDTADADGPAVRDPGGGGGSVGIAAGGRLVAEWGDGGLRLLDWGRVGERLAGRPRGRRKVRGPHRRPAAAPAPAAGVSTVSPRVVRAQLPRRRD